MLKEKWSTERTDPMTKGLRDGYQGNTPNVWVAKYGSQEETEEDQTRTSEDKTFDCKMYKFYVNER